MKTNERKKMYRERTGLVLLIVLGMLAMFSLLAVTYVVTASSSIAGSQAMKRRAQNTRLELEQIGAGDKIIRQLLRGTNDQNSVFYASGNLLGDIYGPNAIRTNAAGYFAEAVIHYAAPAVDPERNVNLVKLSINRDADVNGPLSDMENDYNSRLMTFTEGPLTGQTFRILKYVGRADRATPNPNFATFPLELPWRPNVGGTIDSIPIQYSVLIDLNEVSGDRLTGEVLAPDGTIRSVSRNINDWIAEFGAESLFYVKTTIAAPTAANMIGYKLIINDAPFNYPGIGIEDLAAGVDGRTSNTGFGNIDARRIFSTTRKISPALLPNYDYLSDRSLMAQNIAPYNSIFGVLGVNSKRTDTRFLRLYGYSNEGIDVPDYRDMFLAHQTAFQGRPSITPSFHRPALINYVTHLFGSPSSLRPEDVAEMLRLLDASSGRIMSIRFLTPQSPLYIERNPLFSPNAEYPRLNLPTWTGSAAEIRELTSFVSKHINGWNINETEPNYVNWHGPWDIDNDGDGYRDSVWVDPGLGMVYSPDGRRLKPLVSLLIEDLDSRVNLNVAGDRSHTLENFDVGATVGAKRPGWLSQGMGVGPSDISLRSIFTRGNALITGVARSGVNSFSFFDELYGARHYKGARIPAINYADISLDRVPGRNGPPLNPVFQTNDPIAEKREREFQHLTSIPYQQHSNLRLPGLPLSKHGSIGMTFDVFGNPLMAHSAPINGNISLPPASPNLLLENLDDKYEQNALTLSSVDDPLGLEDLEVILRRYDADVQAYPSRLRNMFNRFNLEVQDSYGNMSSINREVTTRSAELRHPAMGAAFRNVKHFDNGNAVAAESGAPSYIRFIQWLHSQRYRKWDAAPTADLLSASPPNPTDDPELTYAAITELFPFEFSKGLRMDLNRPFGNGFDSNNNGDVDEPIEMASLESERHPVPIPTPPFIGAVDVVASFPRSTAAASVNRNNVENEQSSYGVGVAQIVRESGNTGFTPTALRRALSSRQLMARNLYCLAQLIIPRDFVFDGMSTAGLTAFERSSIRARAIAQWAVNVVDYRDADSVMTRFEYDILPFGSAAEDVNAPSGDPRRGRMAAYWAPDHPLDTFNDVPNRTYIGVVWGMEMPEILLTETMAYHDKRLKDTDMDNSTRQPSQKINDPAAADPNLDDTLDQYRFPDAGLLIELFVNRTTGPVPSTGDPRFAGSSSSLYVVDNNERKLNLSKLAPLSTDPAAAAHWGRQPVWRIAISETYPEGSPNHPQFQLENGTLGRTTHQVAIEPAVIGGAQGSSITGESDRSRFSFIEQYLGNGLQYFDYRSTPPGTAPSGFDRFIWFTNQPPTSTQRIPDMLPTNTGAANRYVFVSRSPSVTIGGGSYLVVGPKPIIHFGSLTHNQFGVPTPTLYPNRVLQAEMGDVTRRPIYSPSVQHLTLDPNGRRFTATLMNGVNANSFWGTNIRQNVETVICAAEPPSDEWRADTSGNPRIFRDGVGVNISYPNTVSGDAYWNVANIPTRSLNSADTQASRDDGSYGFAVENDVLPDSWVDLANAGAGGQFPDVPLDRNNSALTGMYKSGTYQNVRVAYLQRLADPDLAYDPTINPYITVDWMSIDLTVFNGESSREMDLRDADRKMHDPTPIQASEYRDTYFASRYKTGQQCIPNAGPPQDDGPTGVSYLSYRSTLVEDQISFTEQTTLPISVNVRFPSSTQIQTANPIAFFPFSLGHEGLVDWSDVGSSSVTFGYLNVGNVEQPARNPPTIPPSYPPELPFSIETTLDNERYTGFGRPIGNADQIFAGAGDRMANVLWANRQFATPYEIMMVPRSSPGQFGMHYAVRPIAGPQTRDQFPHLQKFQQMNFWFVNDQYSSPIDLGAPNTHWAQTKDSHWAKPRIIPNSVNADWALLFDFIETTPLFADSQTYWRPDVLSNFANSSTVAARFLNSFIPQGYYRPDGTDPQAFFGPSFLAPFNFKPSYVAAGKINLNTVAVAQSTPNGPIRSHALKALESLYYTSQRDTEFGTVSEEFARSFVENRRGFAIPVPANNFFGVVVNPELHPDYPTQFVGAYRPALTSNLAPTLSDPIANFRFRQRHGVEATLLRNEDLGGQDPNTLSALRMQLNRPAPDDHVNRTQPYDYYQRVTRLPNLVTNQSNIFAVWMTIGLFEYDPITGYGQEYVSNTRGVERERRFYILDRSIPVGFNPGEDLNVKKAILLERKIP